MISAGEWMFYGVQPIEIDQNQKSVGICKLCNCQAETLKHLFVGCNKLRNKWNMVEDLLCKASDMDISADCKTIILGKGIKEKKQDVISRVRFFLYVNGKSGNEEITLYLKCNWSNWTLCGSYVPMC